MQNGERQPRGEGAGAGHDGRAGAVHPVARRRAAGAHAGLLGVDGRRARVEPRPHPLTSALRAGARAARTPGTGTPRRARLGGRLLRPVERQADPVAWTRAGDHRRLTRLCRPCGRGFGRGHGMWRGSGRAPRETRPACAPMRCSARAARPGPRGREPGRRDRAPGWPARSSGCAIDEAVLDLAQLDRVRARRVAEAIQISRWRVGARRRRRRRGYAHRGAGRRTHGQTAGRAGGAPRLRRPVPGRPCPSLPRGTGPGGLAGARRGGCRHAWPARVDVPSGCDRPPRPRGPTVRPSCGRGGCTSRAPHAEALATVSCPPVHRRRLPS